MPAPTDPMRIDKWLWAVRVFRSRGDATNACRLGRVTIAGQAVKPSREVRVGDVVEVQRQYLRSKLQVVALLEHRVGAKLVPLYARDLTPEADVAAARERSLQDRLSRPVAPLFRPSKQERRLLQKFLEQQQSPPPPQQEDADGDDDEDDQ
jgi:ribosome-associated heat shock protein Hsp15